ncbi:28S ribosomal protein S2, mitochondrial [Tetranychus urticae]|uniref:Small ribosomal subunit protein uS2m n=1 Tax=Tetranychus urticae TaxID=32264 RepID=T1KF72_TETUR|nr:28S ribosomal protein S2, mitochondrial [Tetranychus urticae]
MFSFLRPLALHNCFAKLPNLSSKAVRFSSLGSQSVKIAEDPEKVSSSDEPVIINPLDVPDYFGVHQLVSLKQLFDNRVHFGHKEGSLNEYMVPYLYGSRLGVCIIDLNQTVARLKDALNFTAHIAFRGGVILFVSNHKETGQYVEKIAKECGEYAHCRHYQSATFTASEVFFGKVMRLPDLCIFLSTFNNVFLEHDGVRDCAKLFIPSIAICDTNSDPRLVTYPVPGNDDTPSAIHLYCDLFKQAILKGKAAKEEIYNRIAAESNQKSALE